MSAVGVSQSRYYKNRMRNITIHINYDDVSLLGSELPPLDAGVSNLPSCVLAFYNFAKVCDTEKTLERVAVYVGIDDYTVQSTKDGELKHLEKLGHRLARFPGVREIIVKLAYRLIERLWWPGEEPKLSATPLLKHLKPLFGSHTEDMDASVDQMHVQRFIFRGPTSSQERRLLAGLDSDTVTGCREGPSSAIEIK